MPWTLEVSIYQGPFARPKYKKVRATKVWATKKEAEEEAVGASRFWGATRVIRVGKNYKPPQRRH